MHPEHTFFDKNCQWKCFGGYRSLEWEYGVKIDPSSLIFSIDKQTQFKPKDREGVGIGLDGGGIWFGRDIYAAYYVKSISNFCTSFDVPDRTNPNSESTRKYFAGEEQFDIEELEVFQLV